jgi:hypothetical protein
MADISEAATIPDTSTQRGAALDEAHVGDIHGAFGTIRRDDDGPRHNWRARATTLLAILGPGLIVMVGDNDAGAFGYLHAGGPKLRHHPPMDFDASNPGALRQPGDGGAPRRGFRRRSCALDPGAFRQVLGRLQCHRSFSAQCANDCDRVHRYQSGAGLFRATDAALYQRFGFDGLGVIRVGHSPPMVPMLRSAR